MELRPPPARSRRRSYIILFISSLISFIFGFVFLLLRQVRAPSSPESFLPFGYGSITLTRPTVTTTLSPPGLVFSVDLSKNLPIPPPHEPQIMCEAGNLVYSNGRMQHMNNAFVWMHFVNVTFLSENVILHDDQFIILTQACHPRYWPWLYQQPQKVTYEYAMYESAICLGHQHSADFGHWFLEVLPAYCVIPRDVLLKSIVVLPEFHAHLLDGFSLLGVREEQIVTGLGLSVFARNFYTASFVFCGDLTQFLIVSFRTMLVKRFGLWKNPPTKFELHNRWNMSRSCGNFWEIMDAVKSTWPQFPWEECPHVLGIENQAKFFEQVKLLYGIHGSVFANVLFMQDNTALVSVEMEQWLLSFLWLSAYTGKYHTLGRDPRITWRGLTPNILDVSYVLSLIKRGLETLKVI
jgi:hypothetical protein